MKLVTGMVASLVIGTLSFGAFAAKEIQKDEFDQGRQHHDLQDDVTDGRPTRSV